jgi:hypothetical protein
MARDDIFCSTFHGCLEQMTADGMESDLTSIYFTDEHYVQQY